MSRAPRKPPLPPPEREAPPGPFPVAAARTRALVLCPAEAACERGDGRSRARPPRRGGRPGRGDRPRGGRGAARGAAQAAPGDPDRVRAGARGRRAGRRASEIDLVVVDAPLSAVQQRNLERAWSCKVIDRTGLILEIFGERARTSEGRLQVELAALTYQRSRLVRSWTHLERQRGGFGFLGGPGRVPDRARPAAHRRAASSGSERELEAVQRTRGLHRAARERVGYPVIALVGYTNAGKSTLFNRLTGAAVGARDQLFATLDPTMRVLAPAVGPAGDPVRHRRLRRRSADRPDRRLPRHAGGGAHRGSGAARARHGSSRERGAAAGRARGAAQPGAGRAWRTRGACSSSGTSSICCRQRTAPSCAAPPSVSRRR